jgi:predicted Zn-dependent peptidase
MTELRRSTLGNGLRVLLAPIRTAAAVGVSVHYDVGFRSEPVGRSGFAHLFEHLMFQGSAHHPKLEHWRYVQGLGGTANGSTHQDYTDYYQLLPPEGLEHVLAMEADRMGALLISEATLRNQRAVVKEEIRLNVLNRAYGGFPWVPLPALLYRTYRNSHNGYGDFTDLDRATAQDAADFYRTHYVPANAVLTVAGAFDVGATEDLVERFFGPLPARPAPTPSAPPEPPLTRSVHGFVPDAHAPLPALALGYRLPDPATELGAYVARMALCEILTAGHSSVLHETLVRDRALAVRVAAGCGLFNSLDARSPDTLALVVTHHPGTDPDVVLAATDAALSAAADRLSAGSLLLVAARRLATRVRRRSADLLARTRAMGAYELLHGRAELVDDLPERVAAVDHDAIARAMTALLSSPRAELRLVPGRTAAGSETSATKANQVR